MIKVFTAFSGYDSQCLALRRLNLNFDLVGWSEIDKFAIQAHNALFPEFAKRNFGDISKIDWNKVPDFDLFTYSSPCQDFSYAGLQRGGEKGSGTRSSLLWECEKAISLKRPKICILENVSALVSKKFIKLFNRWQLILEKYGYRNFCKVLNGKDYGVPQHRERVFLISILDKKINFYFPKKIQLKKTLKDFLQKNVNESYYLNETQINSFVKSKYTRNRLRLQIKPYIRTLCASGYKNPELVCVGNVTGGGYEKALISNRRVYSYNGIIPTITTNATTRVQPKFLEENGLRIRKITETEALRLMGVSDSDIKKIQNAGLSKTQQYKLAGNSIIVDVLVAIFRKLFIDTKQEEQQQVLF